MTFAVAVLLAMILLCAGIVVWSGRSPAPRPPEPHPLPRPYTGRHRTAWPRLAPHRVLACPKGMHRAPRERAADGFRWLCATWRGRLPRWWDWRIVQAYYYRKYKRADRKAFQAEMRLVRDGTAPWLRALPAAASARPDGTAPAPASGAVPLIPLEPSARLTAVDGFPAITQGRRFIHHGIADGTAVFGGPWEHREVER